MANRVWNGGDGDWFDVANWTTTTDDPNSYPLPGDTVTIASGTVSLIGSEAQPDGASFDSMTVTLGTADGPPALLDAVDAVIGDFFIIHAAGSSGLLASGNSAFTGVIGVAAQGTFTLGSGQAGSTLELGVVTNLLPTGALDLEGTIMLTGEGITTSAGLVNNAFVSDIDSPSDIEGDVTGTGTFQLGLSATLLFGGSVASGQTIRFSDAGAELQLADPASFAGSITGLRSGDVIDLTTVSATRATYDQVADTITLDNGPGTDAVATVENVTADPGSLTATADGSGGTLIGYAGAQTALQYGLAGADRAIHGDIVRSTMVVPGTATPIDGSGVKIGIISDSFDEVAPGTADQDAASGYLPATASGTSAVTVLSEGPDGSTDEGRGIAELIHETAPGAQLYFASASASGGFPAAVAALQSAGVNIIVDDEIYPGPHYQIADAPDAAVSAAIAAGIDYFSAAGNSGNHYYENNFDPQSVTLLDGETVDAQIFSNGTPYLSVYAYGDETLSVDWAAPFEGAGNEGAPGGLTMELFDSSGNLVATSAQQTSFDGNTLVAQDLLTTPTPPPTPPTGWRYSKPRAHRASQNSTSISRTTE